MYETFDERTGRCVGMAMFGTEARAWRALVGYWRRDRRGRRPDLHEQLLFLAVRKVDRARCTGLHVHPLDTPPEGV